MKPGDLVVSTYDGINFQLADDGEIVTCVQDKTMSPGIVGMVLEVIPVPKVKPWQQETYKIIWQNGKVYIFSASNIEKYSLSLDNKQQ